MKKAYLGLDIGSISTKGVIIDSAGKIISREYIWTKADPISAVKKLLPALKEQVDLTEYNVVSSGVTGSARKLIGTVIGAAIVKK